MNIIWTWQDSMKHSSISDRVTSSLKDLPAPEWMTHETNTQRSFHIAMENHHSFMGKLAIFLYVLCSRAMFVNYQKVNIAAPIVFCSAASGTGSCWSWRLPVVFVLRSWAVSSQATKIRHHLHYLWENHRKTIGKWWFNEILWDIPLVMTNIAIEHDHRNSGCSH